jgi:hypothetical protein
MKKKMKKFWNYYLKTYPKGSYPIFVNLFFGIPINSTTFSRFYANYIQHQLLQYVYLLLFMFYL